MFTLTSPAFSDGGPIPRAHTCDGADLSPPIHWTDTPNDTRQFALICDDPDAPVGVFVHWVLYGLPPAATSLPSGVPKEAELKKPVVARQGTNGFGRMGYGGPCPPKGPPHRYIFRLYALDRELDAPPRATKEVLLKAMRGHVLAEATLTGKYGR